MCLAWIVDDNHSYAISDSRVSSGPERIDCFAKIDAFGEANLFICWEGYTGYTLPILKDLSRLVGTSTAFATWSDTSTEKILGALTSRINRIWRDIERDLKTDDPSFVVGTFDFEKNTPRLFLFEVFPKRTKESRWECKEVLKSGNNPLGLVAIGSGKPHFEKRLLDNISKKTQILKSFVGVIEDTTVTCTGGIPHVVKLDRRGIESFGILKDKQKYFLSTQEDEEHRFPKSVQLIDYQEFKQGVMQW